MNWKRIIKYHARWQSGFVVSFPVVYICQEKLGMPLWASILLFQFVGALIYYNIDHFIFKK